MSNIKSSITMKILINRQGHYSYRQSFYRSNRGFTLLEALIGFLILSIGMLGIASLQAISLKAGKTSVYGSVAMMKVEEIVESMRANPAALADYAAAGDGEDKNCTGNNAENCSTEDLAIDDIYWWQQNLTAGLPDVATTTTEIVHTPPTPPSNMATVTVTINWAERNKDAQGSSDKSYAVTAAICVAVPC